ncbi:hypothetical protein [Nonomuraea sp. NPDC050310]|uniref:hypothetical protein n=1 Tax=Nonomuraea sp. NPDC050310 TaxID=3154935 RepID=UPI0033EDD621
MSGEQRKFELSVPQIAGGALAAVTAAVAASYLGVAGTFIGAAVASVASTVGGAVYTHYLKRTGEAVKEHTLGTWRRQDQEEGQGELATAVHATPAAATSGEPQSPASVAPVLAAPVDPHAETGPMGVVDPGAETVQLAAVPSGRGSGDTLVMTPVSGDGGRRPLPWLKLVLAAALVFAISVGGILTFQALAHRTVHEAVTGKTPVAKKAPKDDERRERQREEERPRQTADPTPERTQEREPTPTPTPTPTDEPTNEPTQEPTTEPTTEAPIEPSGEPEATVPPEDVAPEQGDGLFQEPGGDS